MLDFVYYPVSGILWFWHKVFSLVSGSPDNGVVWALSVVFLVFTLKALLFKPFVKQVRTQTGDAEAATSDQGVAEEVFG